MKLGIVIGSIREGRVGAAVGEWVAEQARLAEGVEVTVIDLKQYDIPLLTGAVPPMGLNKEYAAPGVQRFSAAMDAVDAYVFVTPEYNHSVPGAFKNAIDSIGPELVGKPVGFVSYGADNGVRAVEHWRTIVANFSMHAVRAQVSLSLFSEIQDGQVRPEARRVDEAKNLVDQLRQAAARASA